MSAMLQSYEAVVEKDHIQWLNQMRPETKQPIRVLVVVETPSSRKGKLSSGVLEESRGILGKDSIPSLDKKLANLRKEWN